MIMPYATILDGAEQGVFHLTASGCAYYHRQLDDGLTDNRNTVLAFLPGSTGDLATRTVTFPTGLTIDDGVRYEYGGGTLKESEIDSPDVDSAYEPAARACSCDGIEFGRVFYANTASPIQKVGP